MRQVSQTGPKCICLRLLNALDDYLLWQAAYVCGINLRQTILYVHCVLRTCYPRQHTDVFCTARELRGINCIRLDRLQSLMIKIFYKEMLTVENLETV